MNNAHSMKLGESFMQYRVFVQSRTDDHFVASIVEMPNLVVEGETEAEAITKVKAALENRLATGKLVTINVNVGQESQETVPQMKYAGIFSDDSTFDDWMEKMAAIRREANAVEDWE
jgi:predicted RNase H-like HicB family nuclease